MTQLALSISKFMSVFLCLCGATPSLTTSLALIKSFAVHAFTVHRYHDSPDLFMT